MHCVVVAGFAVGFRCNKFMGDSKGGEGFFGLVNLGSYKGMIFCIFYPVFSFWFDFLFELFVFRGVPWEKVCPNLGS